MGFFGFWCVFLNGIWVFFMVKGGFLSLVFDWVGYRFFGLSLKYGVFKMMVGFFSRF